MSTTAADIIHYYNHLNGNSISLPTLVNLHERVSSYLDSVGHGPYTTELKGILTRTAKAIKIMRTNKAEVVGRLELTPLEIKKTRTESIPEKHRKKIEAQNKRMPKPIRDVLNGIEYGLETQNLDKRNGLGFTKEGQTKIYDMVTDMVQKAMKKDGLFWRQKWDPGKTPIARNFPKSKPYQGANWAILTLMANLNFGYSSPYFLTFKSIKDQGGTLRRKAIGWPVIFYTRLYKYNGEKISEEKYNSLPQAVRAKEVDIIPIIQYYKVFNGQDVEGVDLPKTKYDVEIEKRTEFERLEFAEKIVENMPNRPDIDHGNRTAHFLPTVDKIDMPHKKAFTDAQSYYSVLFHEMVHSTGHKSRLNRPFAGDKESKEYMFEELVAELGASYLCAEAGILYHTINDSANYVKHYSKSLLAILKEDNKFFLKAAAAAQKAVDYILIKKEARPSTKAEKVVKREKFVAKSRGKKRTLPSDAALEKEIHDLWHISRTALARQDSVSRFDRMKYVKRELLRSFPALAKTSPKKLWFKIEDVTAPTKQVAGIPKKTKLVKKPIKRPRPPATRNTQPATRNLSGVTYDYAEIDLGPYKDDFHRMMSDTIVQIHGLPGHGKTVWLLKYAQYLAEQGKHVLYVAREEYGRSVFDIKQKEHNIGHDNLRFDRDLKPEDIKWATTIFLDSVDALGIDHKDMEKLILDYPNRNWYPVKQSTKDGDFRGSQEWEHLVDVAGEIRNRKLILTKNRLDPNNSAKAEKLRTDDAIAENKKKAEIRNAVKESLQSPSKKQSPVTSPQLPATGNGQPETQPKAA